MPLNIGRKYSSIILNLQQLNIFRMRDCRAHDANLPANRHKNRSMAVVPFDANRVKLQTVNGIEGSDYINASWVDGYRSEITMTFFLSSKSLTYQRLSLQGTIRVHSHTSSQL